jgi:YidC/Oxa1 family membrane protein insertase
VPYNDLGLAIILLTILIRTILLIPSQKALKSQRKMNELQPKLAKIKEKYKDNQEMIAKETMALWKEYKVNPFGSCLPLLIQFPVLIALFYVIQNGLNPDNSYLLYEPLKHFSLHNINIIFLGILNLTKINNFILPLIVGGLQFLQMKLTLVTKKDKKAQDKQDKTEKKAQGSEMEMAGKTMMYVMPVMIALFTASVPAGVGLYWSVSTTYGIVQQLVVNKQVDEEKVKIKVLPDKQ